MVLSIIAYEGTPSAASFSIELEDLSGTMSDGLLIERIGKIAAQQQQHWTAIRAADAKWVVMRDSCGKPVQG